MSDVVLRSARDVCCAIVCISLWSIASAQGIPDRNVNVIGINPPLAEGQTDTRVPDPGLKQQNEPACAMKPSNPLQIICAFNDYRAVDNPLIGDAWEGFAYTLNGGQTWFSDLLPGHPGDSPNIGFEFAADPQVTAAPGIALVNYIAADRGDNAAGGLFVHRLFEVNREAGSPWAPEMLPQLITSGNAGQFVDKPVQMLHLEEPGSGTVTVSSTLKDGTSVSQEVPAGRLFVAYATFIGNSNNPKSRITVARSDDYGVSWTKKKVTRGNGLNQSAALAAHGDNVCAVWRRFEKKKDSNAIMASCSTNRGNSWSNASEISAEPEFFPFDQGTTETTFRVNSYPVITSDGSTFYAFWASRIDDLSPFFARIVYSTSVDGSSWSTPTMLEDPTNGHQFMPVAAAARGEIQLAWYDTRNDLFQGTFIQDILDESTDPVTKIIRHPGDVRTLKFIDGVPTGSTQVSRYVEGARTEDGPVEQLEFNFLNDRLFQIGTVPFDGDYPNVAAPLFRLDGSDWISNAGPPGAGENLKPVDFLVSFTDNRDVRGNVWNDLNAATIYTPADQTPAMAAAGKEARELETVEKEAQLAAIDEAPSDNANQEHRGESLIAAGVADSVLADAEPDPTAVYPQCVPDGNDFDRTRNQNVYSSVVRPGVSIESPSASKPNGVVQRAHVIWVSNNTNGDVTYTVTIDEQPGDAPVNGRASFLQVPVAPFPDVPPEPPPEGLLTEIAVDIDANSTVARTVFITSMIPNPPINVSVSDGGGATLGTLTLNPDILTPDVQNPDVQNPDPSNPDIQNGEVHNPDVQNPVITTVQNPDVQNPDVQNPDVQNPDVQNPDYQNPDVQNPDIQNPDLQNEPLDGSSTENPDTEHPSVPETDREEGYTDITWEVTNNGNTTTAFNIDAFVNKDITGLSTQLIATRTQSTQTARDCVQGTQVQNVVIFNLINPDPGLFEENTNAGIFGDGSAFIAPSERIFATLRIWGDPVALDIQPEDVGIRIESQSCNSLQKIFGTVQCDPPFEQVGELNPDEPPEIFVDPEPVPVPDALPSVLFGAEFIEGDIVAEVSVSVSAFDEIDEDDVQLQCEFTDDVTDLTIDESEGSNELFIVGTLLLDDDPVQVDCMAQDTFGIESMRSFTIDAIDGPPQLFIGDEGGPDLTVTRCSASYNVFYQDDEPGTEFPNPWVTVFDSVDTFQPNSFPTLSCNPLSGGNETVFPPPDPTTGEPIETEVSCEAGDSAGNFVEGTFTLVVSQDDC